MSQVKEEHAFDVFAIQMRASLAAALKWGDGKLYTSDAADLDQVYLSGFSDATDRQYHNCSACKSFLKRYGGLLVTNGTEVRPALWQFASNAPSHFILPHAQMHRAVFKARINGIFASKFATLGEPETNGWTHFWIKNPKAHSHPLLSAGQWMAQQRQDFLTLRRGLAEFDLNTFAQVHTLMSTEAAYRSAKFEGLAKSYFDLKTKITALDQRHRDAAIWHALAGGMPAGIRSSALGTLYADLDGGMAAADALRRFKAIVDPRVYQQPTAAPKAGNIKRAEEIFESMGLARSLERRVATFQEIVERCAWRRSMPTPGNVVFKTQEKKPAGIFGSLAQPVQAGPTQTVASSLSLRKFMEQRAQNSFCMQVVGLDRPHSLGTITAAVHADAQRLFAWHGNYAWYRWFGATGKDFNLPNEVDVLAILDLPSTWFDAGGSPKGLMFVLNDARDQNSVGAGIPAEGLRSELHEVKRTIVAHSLTGTLQPVDGQHAAGLVVRQDNFKPFVIRTFNGSLAVDHAITSWE